MAFPKEALSVVYGWVDPITKRVIPYKVLIARYFVDVDYPFPSPITEKTPPEGRLTEEARSFYDRYSRFTMGIVNGKVRFFVYSDPELTELKRLLDADRMVYTVTAITLTPEQETTIASCETEKAHVREVIKRLGL